MRLTDMEKEMLMDKALLKRFAKVGKQNNPDPIIVARFYIICSQATFFAVSYDPDDELFFGWAGMFPDDGVWGFFSLDGFGSLFRFFDPILAGDADWKEKRVSEVFF